MSPVTAEPESLGMSSTELGRIDRLMESYVTEQGVVGISTLLARRGQVVHAGQYGYQDAEAGIPMAGDTIFRLYSMTMPVVSTALMLLHEEGRFQLEHPVATYLPAFADTKVMTADGELVERQAPLDVHSLLCHTSGLTYDWMTDNPVAALYRHARISNDANRSLGEMVDVLAELPLASQPWERWHYSVSTDVAARLIEIVADQPLGDFLEERLFRPLGMVDTAFGVPDGQLHRLAAMYGLPDLLGKDHTGTDLFTAALDGVNERIDVSDTYPTDPDRFQRGVMGLFSTVTDYYRFARMLADGGIAPAGTPAAGTRLIGTETLALMHRNHLPSRLLPYEILSVPYSGLGFGLGCGIILDSAQSDRGGCEGEVTWTGAAKTLYWVDAAHDTVGVFMSQYMAGIHTPDQEFRMLAEEAIVDGEA